MLPTLLNTMVVQLCKDLKHYSINYLQGYIFVHRLFLMFAERYPSLKEYYNSMVNNFLRSEKYRVKGVVSDLGRFLTYLSFADLSWDDIASAYLHENFDRSVLWLLRTYPWLEHDISLVNDLRTAVTFVATKTSIKLLMFQVYFLKTIARPQGVTLQEIARRYDENLGRPDSNVR